LKRREEEPKNPEEQRGDPMFFCIDDNIEFIYIGIQDRSRIDLLEIAEELETSFGYVSH